MYYVTLYWKKKSPAATTAFGTTPLAHGAIIPRMRLDWGDFDLIQALGLDFGPAGCSSLGVISEKGGSSRITLENPVNPNDKGIPDNTAIGLREFVPMAFVILTDPGRSTLGQVGVITVALRHCQ